MAEIKKWILCVEGDAVEVFEGTREEAENAAYEAWLNQASQDYLVEPYTKAAAIEAGLEDEDDE